MGSQRVGHDSAASHSLSCSAQLVKNLPAMQETWVRVSGQEDPLEEEMAPHSSILAWRIPWTEEPGGYSLRGCKSQTRLGDYRGVYVGATLLITCPPHMWLGSVMAGESGVALPRLQVLVRMGQRALYPELLFLVPLLIHSTPDRGKTPCGCRISEGLEKSHFYI